MANQQSNLLQALKEAQENGYPHDFLIDETGNVSFYGSQVTDPRIIEIVPCESCGATLYLLACDHVKGTLVHHWESPAN